VAQVVLENIYKTFPHRQSQSARAPIGVSSEPASPAQGVNVLRRVNLTVQNGEFMVLVGPSGCGKSTLLRLIAGLETLTGGNIWVGDRLINDLPPKQRDIAMVFQSYALYPHMTVYDNLAFGLRRTMQTRKFEESNDAGGGRSPWVEDAKVALTRPLPKAFRYLSDKERAVQQRVLTVAEMLQIDPLLDRLPKQLSGGQKQRVALGRAMARNPQVFLMDEPLSNLDAKLRTETRAQIVNLQRKLGTTTIYVTHDQTEAMTMGDRIAVMNAGQLQQVATPLELYHHPANQFVAEFIGSPPINLLPVQVKAPLLVSHPQFRMTLPDLWEEMLKPYDGRSVTLGIRPEHLQLSVPAPKNLPIRVERIEALGSDTYILGRLMADTRPTSSTLQIRVEPDRAISQDELLWFAILPDKIHLFDPQTGQALNQR
jgi:multiple sugar transport system ATP-binding protein